MYTCMSRLYFRLQFVVFRRLLNQCSTCSRPGKYRALERFLLPAMNKVSVLRCESEQDGHHDACVKILVVDFSVLPVSVLGLGDVECRQDRRKGNPKLCLSVSHARNREDNPGLLLTDALATCLPTHTLNESFKNRKNVSRPRKLPASKSKREHTIVVCKLPIFSNISLRFEGLRFWIEFLVAHHCPNTAVNFRPLVGKGLAIYLR